MQTIKGYFDGENYIPLQPAPVKGRYDVIITFIQPSGKKIGRPPFEYGSMAGRMWMADDFNEPLEDFKEYME